MTDKQPAAQEVEREEFEKWAAKFKGTRDEFNLETNPNGDYTWAIADMVWRAWQASKSPTPPVKRPCPINAETLQSHQDIFDMGAQHVKRTESGEDECTCICTGCGQEAKVRVALIGDIKICPDCIHGLMYIVESQAPHAVTWKSSTPPAIHLEKEIV